MSFFKTTGLYKFFYLILILSLISFSCSSNDSITGNSYQNNLGKPSEITEIFDTNTDDDKLPNYLKAIENFIASMLEGLGSGESIFSICFLSAIMPDYYNSPNVQSNDFEQQYDFRDNFLLKSQKGYNYTISYYILSEYGIKNNLVMKHPIDHLSIMNMGIEVSQVLQHGINDNQILITRSTYDECREIVKIYRESENHTDIDVVLDYLETDLEKYYNKTKAEIAMDFE